MTKEAQRIAIAEACGWKYWHDDHENLLLRPDEKWPSLQHWRERGMVAGKSESLPLVDASGLPDYLNDLNAMHEAEWADGGITVKAMRFWLWHICDEMTGHSASAAQRAEAFLRAKGLWVEEMVESSAGK